MASPPDTRDDEPAQDAEALSGDGGSARDAAQRRQEDQQSPTVDRARHQEAAADAVEEAAQPQPPPPPPPQQQAQDQADDQRAGPDEAASPPLPGRRTAATAGPRATRLRETYAHALRRTLAKLATWEHFAGCYPTVAARAEGVLRQVQAQMVEKLGDKCEVGSNPFPPPGAEEREGAFFLDYSLRADLVSLSLAG